MKTADLTGALLNYWVARGDESWKWAHEIFPAMTLDPTFKGVELATIGVPRCVLIPRNAFRQDPRVFAPSTDWAHGGPIIEREQIIYRHLIGGFEACVMTGEIGVNRKRVGIQCGQTLLIAAMRAFVASKFGDEVPDEVQS